MHSGFNEIVHMFATTVTSNTTCIDMLEWPFWQQVCIMDRYSVVVGWHAYIVEHECGAGQSKHQTIDI